jgi:cation diffusion facilitator family transporter
LIADAVGHVRHPVLDNRLGRAANRRAKPTTTFISAMARPKRWPTSSPHAARRLDGDHHRGDLDSHPAPSPAPFTLVVLIAVVVVKETLFRRVLRVASEVGSPAVHADAWHHRSDAITSVAAFCGISVALWKGEGYEAADDWAALVAAIVIAANAIRLLRSAVFDLMDRAPDPALLERVRLAALTVPDVMAIEKLKVRRSGTGLFVDLHVQSDPSLSLYDAHVVSGKVKSAIRSSLERVTGVLIHMEPFEGQLPKP